MYDFILNMWTLKKITEETVNSYVPRFITAEQAAEIIATPQTGWIGGGGSSGGGTDPELAQTVNALKEAVAKQGETISGMQETVNQQGQTLSQQGQSISTMNSTVTKQGKTLSAQSQSISTMNDTIKQQGESITQLQGDVKKEKDVTDALLGIEETEESEVTE